MPHIKLTVGTIALVILAIVAAIASYTTFYRVDATEIVVFQAPYSGTLTVESVPGTYMRVGASAHDYKKQDNYSFEYDKNPALDHSIRVQFNDGGIAWIGGNLQWEMPTDPEHVLAMHTLYGSQEAVDKQVVRNAINRAMTFTAPLMSATESYAARRAELLSIFADQLENGIYRMQTSEQRAVDPISGELRTVKITAIVRGANGLPVIAEESALKKYGIHIQPPTITHIVYEPKVEEQIQKQRDLVLQIQTGQAEVKQAEQRRLTAQANGEAKATETRWEQEAIKAREVTKAEQEKAVAELQAAKEKNVAETAAQRDLDVATLQAAQAEQYKIQQTLMGEGEAARKAAVITADGALEQKLKTYENVQAKWADAMSHMQVDVVPRVVTGGTTGGAMQANAAQQMMELMSIKAANDLALDFGISAAPRKR